MSRLPTPGGDDNTWGNVLNDFLSQEHNSDGTQKTLDVTKGGTGATDAATARTNLGAASTTDLSGKLDKSTVTTKGDLLAATGNAAITRVGLGSDGFVLTADSTQTAGVKWDTAAVGASTSAVNTWTANQYFKSGVPWFDVKAYGATGDGVTDDTTALSSAVTAAASGGVIYFPVGIYKLVTSAQLDIPSNVTLCGAGWASVLLVSASGANGYVRLPTGNTGITVENMTIRRGNTTASRLLESHAGDCTIRAVRFEGNSTAGTGLTCGAGADGLLVTDCLFDGINGFGFSANGVNGLRLISNRWKAHTGGSAAYLNTNNTKFAILGNDILMDPAAVDSAIGVYTAASASVATHGRISNNYIETVNFGIEVIKTSLGDAPAFVTVSGNVLKALAGQFCGISLAGKNCTVEGNTVDTNGVTGLYSGIEIPGPSDSCSIVGNTIYGDGCLDNGIIIDKSSNCTVSGNTVRGFHDAANSVGISIFANGSGSSNNNTVTGNQIYFPSSAIGSLEFGILVESNAAGAHVDRTLIAGNQVYGNNVTNSRGISLDLGAGTIDGTVIGTNSLNNVATPLFQSGDTNTSSGGSILTETMSLDKTAIGTVVTKAAGEALAFGDPVYFKSDGKVWKADADGASTYPCIGMAIATIGANALGRILLTGTIRNDVWTWTVGGIIYLSTSAGLTQIQPAATDNVIQMLGIAHPDSHTIFFRPSLDYITHT